MQQAQTPRPASTVTSIRRLVLRLVHQSPSQGYRRLLSLVFCFGSSAEPRVPPQIQRLVYRRSGKIGEPGARVRGRLPRAREGARMGFVRWL